MNECVSMEWVPRMSTELLVIVWRQLVSCDVFDGRFCRARVASAVPELFGVGVPGPRLSAVLINTIMCLH